MHMTDMHALYRAGFGYRILTYRARLLLKHITLTACKGSQTVTPEQLDQERENVTLPRL